MANRTKRCAIYTRKSSEEGLEQSFNSLDAQREACEAYIRSQQHEGWTVLPQHYDDGGYSGGTMDRPALKQLLADIEAGTVDIIVTYKVDRLTRALTDFARIIETLDKHGVSFVSVTQQFSTTNSMGRLTLNVLLSFAQYERELTGERIRDKIAASKRKGMWMGGFVPLGYSANDRTLAVNETEAELVRTIFGLYLELGTVPAVEAELLRRSVVSPTRVTASGKIRGGRPFSRGHLFKLVSNPIYIGQIAHKGVRHRGQHPAIIDQTTWDAVQQRLEANTQGGKRTRSNVKESALLAGLLFDEAGHALRSTHTVKHGRRYRYYTTQPDDGDKAPFRLSASEIEPVVVHQVRAFLEQPARLIDALALTNAAPDALNSVIAAGRSLADTLQASADQRDPLSDLIDRVTVGEDALLIALNREGLAARLGVDVPASPDGAPVLIQAPLRIARRGVETRLIIEGHSAEPARAPDPVLVSAVARGHTWFEDLTSGRANSIKQIADREGMSDRYVKRLLDLAFLPPALVEDILDGRQSPDMTVERLAQGDLRIALGAWSK